MVVVESKCSVSFLRETLTRRSSSYSRRRGHRAATLPHAPRGRRVARSRYADGPAAGLVAPPPPPRSASRRRNELGLDCSSNTCASPSDRPYSIMPLDPDIAAELKSLGADADALVNTARTSRSSLTDTLKALGYNKMGARKKVEQALVAAAAAKPEAAVAPAPAEDAATGSQPPPAEEKAAAPPPPPPPQPTPAPAPAAPASPATPLRRRRPSSATRTPHRPRAPPPSSSAVTPRRSRSTPRRWACAPTTRTLLSNRSAAFLCIGHSENALDDATRCVKLRPNWGKAHGRHGAALAALGCTHDAVLAYERGVKLTPDSAPMRTELSRLRTLLASEERRGRGGQRRRRRRKSGRSRRRRRRRRRSQKSRPRLLRERLRRRCASGGSRQAVAVAGEASLLHARHQTLTSRLAAGTSTQAAA